MTLINHLSASSTTNTQGFKKKTAAGSGALGFKNVLILFFSAMAVSLVILVLCFGIFFQKLDFSLNTKPLENAPTIIDPTAPMPDETETTALPDSQLDEVFNEIRINVPTDAYKMGKQAHPTVDASTTHSAVKTKPTEAYVGVGTDNSSGNSLESASDVKVEVEPAPPLPKVRTNKTAPVAENNGSSKVDEFSSSNEPDLMPMTPVPSQ
jgi:hypothetical protein